MRIKIISVSCRRCGKSIATLNKSLYGCDDLKAKLDRICTDCITKERGGKNMGSHLYIKIVDGRWFATDLDGKWLTAQETAQAIATGATYEFVD